MKPTILIHPFQAAPEQEEEFLNAWKAVDQYMRKQKGFIKTKLHRSLEQKDSSPFNFVNIAVWESPEVFQKVIRNNEFIHLAKDVLKFSCGAGLYEIFIES